MHLAGIEADMLHDVDLATVGPRNRLVVGQHPDRRPAPDAARQLRADFDRAICPARLAERAEPRRAVALFAPIGQRADRIRVGARLDDQRAFFDPRILGAVIGIILLLIVEPPGAVMVGVIGPFAIIGQPVDRELIRPDELIVGRDQRFGACSGRHRRAEHESGERRKAKDSRHHIPPKSLANRGWGDRDRPPPHPQNVIRTRPPASRGFVKKRVLLNWLTSSPAATVLSNKLFTYASTRKLPCV